MWEPDIDAIEERWYEDNYEKNIKGYISLYHFDFLDWLAESTKEYLGWRYMVEWVECDKERLADFRDYEKLEFEKYCNEEGDALADREYQRQKEEGAYDLGYLEEGEE